MAFLIAPNNLLTMTEQGKKVWKELEKMGWSNEPKDFHLEYFEDIIEATKKALTIPVVVGQSEQLKAYNEFVVKKIAEGWSMADFDEDAINEFLSL